MRHAPSTAARVVEDDAERRGDRAVGDDAHHEERDHRRILFPALAAHIDIRIRCHVRHIRGASGAPTDGTCAANQGSRIGRTQWQDEEGKRRTGVRMTHKL